MRYFRFLLFFINSITAFWLYGQLSFEENAIIIGIEHQYNLGTSGGGVSFFDFSGDGFDDLALAKSDGIAFYLNNGQGQFSSILPFGLQSITENVKQIIWVDFDNDGDFDLFYTSETFNRLFLNLGNLHFQEVTTLFELAEVSIPSFAAAWGDVNLDGYLDLYVSDKTPESISSNRLYINQNGNRFTESSIQFGVQDQGKKPFALAFTDINNDLYPDLYIAQDREAGNTLLVNRKGEFFQDISISSNTNLFMEGMSVTIVDIDRNGYLDLYITNIESGNKFLINNGDELFSEEAYLYGIEFFQISWGANFLDADNDGDNDLYVSSSVSGIESKSAFFINDMNQLFQLNLPGMEKDTAISYANAIGDYNNDGKLDIIVNNTMPYYSHLWKNTSITQNWIKISLVGTVSNTQGVGVRMVAFNKGIGETKYTTCGHAYLAQNSHWEHFGLGDSDQLDSIIVYWPSGIINSYYDMLANRSYYFVEHLQEDTITVAQSQPYWCENSETHLISDYRKDIQWSDGTTNQRLPVTQPGSYHVSGLFHDGTFQSGSISMETGNEILWSFAKQDITCFGQNDGMIEISKESNVSIIWNDGNTTWSRQDLGMGVYEAYLYQNGYCGQALSFTISEPSKLQVFIEKENFGSFQKLNALMLGGTQPYELAWEYDGQVISTDQSIVPDRDGIYKLSVIDFNGCLAHFSIYFEVSILSITDKSILIFPNPTSNVISVTNLNVSQIKFASLLDLSGSPVYLDFIYQDNQITFDLSNLPNAVYLFKLHFHDDTYFQKAIIKD